MTLDCIMALYAALVFYTYLYRVASISCFSCDELTMVLFSVIPQ